MLISVVIPARNAAAFLERSVGSVLAQRHPEWELLLVDNASTDGTRATMDRLAAAHPGHIRVLHEARPGASRARNAGLAAARGEWVQFLDADDELHPDKLAHQAALLDAGTDWLIAAYRVDDATGYRHDNLPHPDPWRGLVYGYRTGYTCSNLYRRTILTRLGGWNEDLPDGEDPELHFRLLAAGAPHRRDERVLTYYHHRPGGLSQRDPVGGNQRRITLYARVIDHLIRQRPDYFATHRDYFFGALLRAIRILATHDLDEATAAYAAYFDPADGWAHPHPAPLNPRYTVLYSRLGFRRSERLRLTLARLLPPGPKRMMK